VLVKDRWIGPHEQVLNVPITYWYYGPSKPSSLTSTEGDFTLTASMVGLGEKLGTDPQIGQLVMLWIGSRALFSQEQWLCPSLLTASRKVAICGPREIRMVDGHTRIECGKHVACCSGFPLAGCTSFQIAATLGYEYHLFVAVIT
jgi:hypothetical protein